MSKFNQNCSWRIKFPCHIHVIYFVWALMGWRGDGEIDICEFFLACFFVKKQEVVALGMVVGNRVLGINER